MRGKPPGSQRSSGSLFIASGTILYPSTRLWALSVSRPKGVYGGSKFGFKQSGVECPVSVIGGSGWKAYLPVILSRAHDSIAIAPFPWIPPAADLAGSQIPDKSRRGAGP